MPRLQFIFKVLLFASLAVSANAAEAVPSQPPLIEAMASEWLEVGEARAHAIAPQLPRHGGVLRRI